MGEYIERTEELVLAMNAGVGIGILPQLRGKDG